MAIGNFNDEWLEDFRPRGHSLAIPRYHDEIRRYAYRTAARRIIVSSTGDHGEHRDRQGD
jgi:hypothetical protein